MHDPDRGHAPRGPLRWLPDFPVDGPALIDGGALERLFGIVLPLQRWLTRRTATRDPFDIRPDEAQVNLDFDRPWQLRLPPVNLRRGKPLRVVDAALRCADAPVTLVPFGAEPIHNVMGPLIMRTAGETVTLWPFFDGRNAGWWLDRPHAGAIVADAMPDTSGDGDIWFDSRIGQLFVNDRGAFVQANCCDAPVKLGERPPPTPRAGDLWFNTGDDGTPGLHVFVPPTWLPIPQLPPPPAPVLPPPPPVTPPVVPPVVTSKASLPMRFGLNVTGSVTTPVAAAIPMQSGLNATATVSAAASAQTPMQSGLNATGTVTGAGSATIDNG